MKDIEKQCLKNAERNEVLIDKFKLWLKSKDLVDKTITKHINNIYTFVNDYLNHYENIEVEDGIGKVYEFLNDWYIRKNIGLTSSALKEMASSIKKFYNYLEQINKITSDEYKKLCQSIKNNMDNFLNSLNNFDKKDVYNWL